MTTYRSFILRVHEDEVTEPNQAKQICRRYILLDPACEYRRGFTSLDELFHTLAAEINGDTLATNAEAGIICAVEELLRRQYVHSHD